MMKTPKVADIIKLMEGIASATLAEEWDNPGLQAGEKDRPVRIIRIALDPSIDVVADACKQQADLLITHHPLIFRALKMIDFSSGVGAVIKMAACHQMAIFSAHTNLDSAAGGVNDVLADRIGLANRMVLLPTQRSQAEGLGRIGDIGEPTDLASYALRIKHQLGLPYVTIAGRPDLPVSKAVVCSGSGSSLMQAFFASDAEVFITGDIRYHDARDVEAANRGLIDIGHFASEHLIVDVLRKRIKTALSEAGLDVDVAVCGAEKDPFTRI